MKNIATETKVGIFVVLGIIILTFFTIRVGKIAVQIIQNGDPLRGELDAQFPIFFSAQGGPGRHCLEMLSL